MIRRLVLATCSVSLLVTHASCAETFKIVESDEQISIVTPQLKAAIRKRGYVSGVAGGTFVDAKTGAKDLGFGLDIADWLMEPGSDEAYRDQLDPELIYRFGNAFHGIAIQT